MKRIWLYALSALLIIASTSCKKEQGAEDREEVISSVKDCEGNSYAVVKIGSQYWMAENLRSTKYDTESERANATITTSDEPTYAPYYTDGRNASSEYSEELTAELRKKLGLLYNWAAAVGFETAEAAQAQTEGFAGVRQGICPNGWHLPTKTEWGTMAEAVGGVYSETSCKGAGIKLRAMSGWSKQNGYVAGTDNYGFSALPAGSSEGSNVFNIGYYGGFWTSFADGKGGAYNSFFVPVDDEMHLMKREKSHTLSVRCVKNIQ